MARELLAESGSIFVQIGDENAHRVRALMDEVFGQGNFVTEVLVKKKGSQISGNLESVNDFVLFYAKNISILKFRKLWEIREGQEVSDDFPFIETAGGLRIRLKELERIDETLYSRDLNELNKVYPDARLFALNPLKSGGVRKNQSHDFVFGIAYSPSVTASAGSTRWYRKRASRPAWSGWRWLIDCSH